MRSIRMEDSPSELIFDEFEDQVFRPHRLGHAILGTEASVGRITVEAQRRFHRTYYRPERMVLFARGVLDMDDLIAAAEQAFPGEGQPLISSSALPELLSIPIYNKEARRGGASSGIRRRATCCWGVPLIRSMTRGVWRLVFSRVSSAGAG